MEGVISRSLLVSLSRFVIGSEDRDGGKVEMKANASFACSDEN